MKTTSEINAGDELTTENTAEFETNKRKKGKNETGVLIYSDHPKATRILKTGTILTNTDFEYVPVPKEMFIPAWKPANTEDIPRTKPENLPRQYIPVGDFEATRSKGVFNSKSKPMHLAE